MMEGPEIVGCRTSGIEEQEQRMSRYWENRNKD